jgi:hypothetical protein
MIQPGGTGATRYVELSDGVNAFIGEPASADLSVAVQFFPPGNAACDGSGYATPFVAMAPLSQNASEISAAIVSHAPGTTILQSALEGALRGATAFCINHRQTSPGQDCSVVFVTDGSPTVCSMDTAVLAPIAGDAFTAHGVQTWLIGLAGTDFVQLNEIARLGGTNCEPAGVNHACNASGAAPTVVSLLDYVRDHLSN